MPWLLPAPADFRAQLKISINNPADLRRLSNLALDVTQLGRLSDVTCASQASISHTGGYSEVNLGLICSYTSDYLAAALPATGLRHALLIKVVTHDFGQVVQSIFDPNSKMRGQVDTVLLALDAKMLGLDEPQLADGKACEVIERAISLVKSLKIGVHDNLGATCLLTTLPLPNEPLFGNIDGRLPGTVRSMVESFNNRLQTEVASPGDIVIDIAHLAAIVGLANWHDQRSWHSSKLPFAISHTPVVTEYICRVIGALRGKARKCLVLDLDNTLWGGVIGDDGLEGIKLGQGSATGEAHLEIQQYAMSLRERGIILAVCSKNDEINALLPFSDHPEMVLKKEHITAFVANWTDKATNLREIAAMLNIGVDSLVFLDDNPAEREIIRRELPEVAVPEVGSDPSDYVSILSSAGYFEALSFSDDDRHRAEYYQANAARQISQVSVTNMDDYLASLEMIATIGPFDAISRSRITQLTNKSNQFNLTTKRYSEVDIETLENNDDFFTIQIRLSDKFGDNGLISVVIFERLGRVWECDTWLMSCRVLGRRVEEAVLAYVIEAAEKAGVESLIGRYVPTKKNGLVEHHFENLGFSELSIGQDGTTSWELQLCDYQSKGLPIEIITA